MHSDITPPLHAKQQEIDTILEDVEVAVEKLRNLADALQRVGLDAASQEIQHIVDTLVVSLIAGRCR